MGPFFYTQERDSEKTWAVPPLFSHDSDPSVDSEADDLLYPVLTYRRFGTEYRWQLVQLLSFAGGEGPQNLPQKRFTLFPLYFQQRSPIEGENYTALVPFYGHLQNRLYRDEIFFLMFPIYSQTRKKDVITDNYLFPFFDLRHGDGMHGWQFWPLVGIEHKEVTTQTNGFGEIETIGGYDKFFAVWPVHFSQDTGIGTADPVKFRADLPFYARLRSPQRDSTSVLWPFFTWVDDREEKYHEWEGPYPFVVVARGAGKTVTRCWPLFSRGHNDTLESDYYLWPLYVHNHLHAGALDDQSTRILFYLFANVTEKNLDAGTGRRRVDLWPLFTYHRDFNGEQRLQILAPIEPMLPNNPGVERNWSPLWSLWRSENNPQTGTASQSLLWNFYRHETAPAAKKSSLIFGLFQYQSDVGGKSVRLFYIPVIKTKSAISRQ
ncbi:MAG TPA: hypothetical protein VKU37_01800 [Verrucomicrobiae bacterium]|nr:hypothetical protein [Verrucomicrobiae bacterium]